MQWEQLTGPDFKKAVKKTGICILTTGVLEKHGEHLPLGTDYVNGHRLACLAAEKEPAVVFPPFYFGQIYEAKCFPGTITLPPRLLLELFQGVLDEIGRNGFKKVVIVNAHGGNQFLLRFLAQCSLNEQKPYTLYLYTGEFSLEKTKKWESLLETAVHGHACECETSISLANHDFMVKMNQVSKKPGWPLGRLKGVPHSFPGIWWYADYPEHYAGDARSATKEKGKALQNIQVSALAEFIKAAKADKVAPRLENEFFKRAKKVAS
jgi:creatinine amidohydrolase